MSPRADDVDESAIAIRVADVRARIADAAAISGRAAHDVRLIAVTKTHPAAVVRAGVSAGLRDFGENRVQELVDKRRIAPEASWHFIGRLQRNKVRFVADGKTLIHSVDRTALVDAIEARAARAGVVQPVLVQVNVGDDPAKGGCEVERLRELVAYAHEQSNIRVRGLMTVPPLPPSSRRASDDVRGHFATLRGLRDDIVGTYPTVRELSMGMTADFEVAIEEGATMVRLGTALFGTRESARAKVISTEDPR